MNTLWRRDHWHGCSALIVGIFVALSGLAFTIAAVFFLLAGLNFDHSFEPFTDNASQDENGSHDSIDWISVSNSQKIGVRPKGYAQ